MSKMQKIAAVFLVVAVAAWILEKMEIFAVPGLTAIALCVAMCVEGADLLKGTGKKKNTSRRLAAVLVLGLCFFLKRRKTPWVSSFARPRKTTWRL